MVAEHVRDINDRKRAEKVLRMSEERFKLAAERTSDLIYERDMITGIATFFGDMDAFHGYELGGFPRSFEGFIEHLHPDDVKKAGEAFQLANEQNKPYEVIHRLRRKDGSYVTWLDRATIIKDDRGFPLKMVGAATDITERERAVAALKESDERYRALFDRSLDSVYIHDLEGNFLDANKAALELLHYDPEDIPSLNFASLLSSPDQIPSAIKILDELKQTGFQKKSAEFRLKCKNGKYVDVGVKSSVIYRDSKPYRILGIGCDITERKLAEESLKASEEKYRLVVDNATEAIFIVQDGMLKFVNPVTAKLLGYPK